VYHRAFSIALPKGSAGQGSLGTPKHNLLCFNCDKPGHFAKECPYPKKGNNQNQGNQRQANANACLGHVHYTTMEEIPAGEVVTLGMYLVNQHPAIV